MINVFDVIEELNNVHAHKSKFNNVKDLTFPVLNKKLYKKTKSKNLLIVYHVWDDLRYAKYLYLSLLSQYLYTDIKNFNIKIFFSSSLFNKKENLEEIFEPFTDQIHFKDKKYKYWTSLYSETESYEVIVHVDADLCFCGNKTNFYERLLNKHSSFSNFPYICFSEYEQASNKYKMSFHFGDQLKRLGKIKNNSFKEVKKWLIKELPFEIKESEFDSWIKETKWPWNVFYMYDRDEFSTKEFFNYVSWWFEKTGEWWEEEKLYWLWLNYKNRDFKTINQVFSDDVCALSPIESSVSLDNIKSQKDIHDISVESTLKYINWDDKNKLYLVHPFEYHPDLEGNKTIINFYKNILEKADERYINGSS